MEQVRITNIVRSERADGRAEVSVKHEPQQGGEPSTISWETASGIELPFAEGDVVGSDALFLLSLGRSVVAEPAVVDPAASFRASLGLPSG